MISVCLQSGHERIQSNCDHLLAQGTGAPGEITWTPVTRSKVAKLLHDHGIAVTEIDANANCHGPYGPFNLTLAIHYQSNTGHSGFGVFVPDPSVDLANPTSIKLAKSIASIYAARTKLPNYSSPRLGLNQATWENPNTQYYYLWRTMKGPLALIECGEGATGAPDHALLYTHQDLVASAIAEGICTAFGIKFAAPAPAQAPPAPPVPVPVPPQPVPPVVNPPIVTPAPVVPNPPSHDHPEPAPQLPSTWERIQAFFSSLIEQLKVWF